VTDEFLEARVRLSTNMLDELRSEVALIMEDVQLDGLTIFAAGSFARHEASQYSDIDLFFTYHPSGKTLEDRRTNELKLFGRLIDLVARLQLPSFSGDSKFLQTHDIDEMLVHLGAPEDDAGNYFTLRMLMLLESKCVYGDDAYASALRSIVAAYYRDFDGNEETFQPWFLINDIMRYWKTLLLNYESRRNDGKTPQERSEARAKNFKLRFSRMTTCFATVAALASSKSATKDDVFELALLTPRERLELVSARMPEMRKMIDELLEYYNWFLEQTSLSKEELHARIQADETRREMFARAEVYGSKMYDLLLAIDDARGTSPKLLRYLVI
jgi:predicted nucleotidyltransferase